MKYKIFIGIVAVLVLVTGWYFISPIFNSQELNEASPLDLTSDEEKKEFEAALESTKDQIIEVDDDMDSKALLIKEGNFVPSAHEVNGKALLIRDNGKDVLRFEDFETINGPNLHIYLSSDLEGNDFIDLGELKATQGNVNYDIPKGVNLDKYDKVLIWCVPFKVLFSYAELRE